MTLAQLPKLAAALATAREEKPTVIVAKLDRLSRDVAFRLMAERVPFIVAETGLAMLIRLPHSHAAVAEHERRLIKSGRGQRSAS